MTGGEIIYSVLTAAAPVSAIVSTRIYPADAPLDVDLPACYYDVTLMDSIEGSAQMQAAQISVGCLAHADTTVTALADAVDAVLNGMTRHNTGTWLRGLARTGRTKTRDAEANLWGVLLVYSAQVTY